MANTTDTTSGSTERAKALTEIKSVFEVLQGTRKRSYLIHKERVVIGSVESADIKLVGSKIAPIHAVIEITFGSSPANCTARVLDLASPSGTFVNGAKVVHQNLAQNDVLQIGDATLNFSFQIPSASESLPDKALLLIDEHDVTPIFDYRPPMKEALEDPARLLFDI